MERRADVYGIGMLEKGKQALRHSGALVGRMMIGLLGFVLSNAALPGGGAPFGIAFAAAAPGMLAIPAAVGAAMGYLLHFASGSGVQWMGLSGILLAEWIVWVGALARTHPRKERARQEMLFRLLGAAFGTAAPLFLIKVFTTLTVQDLLSLVSESVAALGACWMFVRMMDSETKTEPGAVLMTAGLVAAALSHICVYDVSIGRVGALTVILFAAGTFDGKGTAVGVALGALMALCGVQKGFGYELPGLWGVGGLIAGVFAPLGSGFLCAALLLGEMAAVFLFGQDPRAYVILLEALAASGIYLLLPVRIRNRWYILLGGTAEKGSAMGTLLLSRLKSTGEALSDIARASDALAKRVERKEQQMSDTPEHLFREVIQTVCRSCPNGAKCWAGSYGETLEGFGRLRDHLQAGGILTAQIAEKCFIQGCVRADALAAQAQKQYRLYQERKKRQRLASRSRTVVTDQFEGLSMIFAEMEQAMRQVRLCDTETEEQIMECFLRNHLDIRSLRCVTDAAEHILLEIDLPVGQWYRLENARKLSLPELTAQLSASLLRVLSPPESHIEGDTVHLCWREMPRYRLMTGSAQCSAEEGRTCGDIVSVFADPEQRELLLISDGMGTGSSAAMDSALTAGILSRLLRAGVGPDAALRLVNSALLSRSEESLATVDLAQVDLYSGMVRFHKAGAAPTYLRRNGHGGSVEAVSLPAGILKETVFEQAEIILHTGDMLVMVSDGAVQGNGEWILQELEHAGMQEPAKLAEHLLRCARAHTEGKADDITVLAALLTDA